MISVIYAECRYADCHGTSLNEVATSACLFYYGRKLLVENVYGIGLKHRW